MEFARQGGGASARVLNLLAPLLRIRALSAGFSDKLNVSNLLQIVYFSIAKPIWQSWACRQGP